MNSRGWYLEKQPSQQRVAEIKGEFQSLNEELRQLCTREDLQPYFSKSPCLADETTLEQLADKSRITAAEKVALNTARIESAEINKRWTETIRNGEPQRAGLVIPIREAAQAEQDKNALDFYEGRITRGEYNKHRQEIAAKAKERLRLAGG
jgi:hypothetical protein